MTTVVTAVGLSKTYRVDGSAGIAYRTLRDELVGLTRRRDPGTPKVRRELVAVRDATFTVVSGEAVGLIGPNGAGKSTLMKMLARVTKPTSGSATIRGRIGALLEVGTGFHPELSGRENVVLSGAILGMSKKEVAAAFDQVVDFAELASFIDVPVKRYSSGMYARLGFAVAAHLRPSLLIVDEVLSVGDLQFQAKCLSHMKALSRDGVSIIFVSHNLLAVADFCERTLVMSQGSILFDGPTLEAVRAYHEDARVKQLTDPADARTSQRLRINGREAAATALATPGVPFVVEVDIPRHGDGTDGEAIMNVVIETPDGRLAVHLRSDLSGAQLPLHPGVNTLSIEIANIGLVPGDYVLWIRMVELGTRSSMWDSGRVPLTVSGDRRVEAIAQPDHRFAARHKSYGGEGDLEMGSASSTPHQ